MIVRVVLLAALLAAPAVAAPPSGGLSVMTYNVHGLPWPLARDRTAAFEKIEARLRKLRAAGRQPRVVALQEAFTDRAKEIGPRSGYRFVATGPARAETSTESPGPADAAYLAAGSARAGEGVGKALDSGLVIFSDDPVVSVRRLAFPDFACAGFDCLANKGVLLVRLRTAEGLIDVATTHLNAKKAAGVPKPRTHQAFRRQVDLMQAFLARHHDPALPLVVAGDFNLGKNRGRKRYLTDRLAGWSARLGKRGFADALHQCAATPCWMGSADVRKAMASAKDWQFFTGGRTAALRTTAVEAPFGRERDGTMLSDHIGYVARYRFTPRAG